MGAINAAPEREWGVTGEASGGAARLDHLVDDED